METWQKLIVLVWGVLALFGSIYGFKKCKYEKNTLDSTGIFIIYGAWVWADIIIFGIFWTLVSVIMLLINNWILFLLMLSLFWVVRSLGETIYWFIQQFSTIPWLVKRHSINSNSWIGKIFHDNYTTWFVIQICYQCITVISLALSIYFAKKL